MQRKISLRLLASLFVTGAIVGPFFDGFHSHSGTLSYPQPWIFKMAWWVPLLFGAAGVAVGTGALTWDTWFSRLPAIRPISEIIAGLLLFGLQYFASGFLKLSPTLALVFLGLFALANWILMDCTLVGLFFSLVTALVGCLVEITLIAFGLFFYHQPDLWGIPFWLPFLYISAACSVGNLARLLALPH